MKISTKSGDKGESGLFSGRRENKSALLFEVLGDLDELQSFAGFCKCENSIGRREFEILERVQKDLYTIMGIVGNEGKNINAEKSLPGESLIFLEKNVEKYEEESEKLNKFILPGKDELSARLHLARTVCRRAERKAVALSGQMEGLDEILKYLNRLSDLLFLMAYKK